MAGDDSCPLDQRRVAEALGARFARVDEQLVPEAGVLAKRCVTGCRRRRCLPVVRAARSTRSALGVRWMLQHTMR